jgi:hypothetical protein
MILFFNYMNFCKHMSGVRVIVKKMYFGKEVVPISLEAKSVEMVFDRYSIYFLDNFKFVGKALRYFPDEIEEISYAAIDLLQKYCEKIHFMRDEFYMRQHLWNVAVVCFWIMVKYCHDDYCHFQTYQRVVYVNLEFMREIEMRILSHVNYNLRPFFDRIQNAKFLKNLVF